MVEVVLARAQLRRIFPAVAALLVLSSALSLTTKADAACSGGAPDGMVTPVEDCDDDNLVVDDGCNAECAIESDWSCARVVNFANLGNNDFTGSGAVWDIDAGNLFGTQSVNTTQPTFATFGEDATRGTYAFKMSVTGGSDDDFIGFAMGFEPGNEAGGANAATADYLLVDWKQATQGGAPIGMALSHVLGAENNGTHFGHSQAIRSCPTPGTECVTELARARTLGSGGWTRNFEHEVLVTYRSDRLTITVDGGIEFDVTPADLPGFAPAVFPAGQIAFYTLSQDSVRYENLAPFGPSVCNITAVADETVWTVTGAGTTVIDVSTSFTDPEGDLLNGRGHLGFRGRR